MPELPDIAVYVEALERRIAGAELQRVRINSPFLLRTIEPPLESTAGRQVREIRRLGKRVAFGLEGELWLVLHLMIAGRLQWKESPPRLAGKNNLAVFDFSAGSLLLTEAGSKRRAGLWLAQGEAALAQHNPGGLEPLTATPEEFQAALRHDNHTLKRALTDPRLLSGIGNAYSDEILHRARLSPFATTQKLAPEAAERLFVAVQATLREWIERLREQAGGDFPRKVTAFHPQMAVHGKFGQPCPVCAASIQRIRYADNETNYCPRCQTGGKILADRSLSRLLKDAWPRHLDDL